MFPILFATLDNLERKIKEGNFRFDLFQRICGHTITLLPLRDRKDDIYPLFKEEMDKNNHSNKKIILDAKAKNFLNQYRWSGNIRQLKRTVELLIAIGKNHI